MFGCSGSKLPVSMGFVWAEHMVVCGPPGPLVSGQADEKRDILAIKATMYYLYIP